MGTPITTKITAFDRTITSALGKEVRRLLEPFAERYGLKVGRQGGNYDATMLKLTLELRVAETADGRSGEQVEFEKYCFIAGLKPEDFGLEFAYSGTDYRVVVIAPKRSRNPVIAIRIKDGKRFVFPREVLQRSA
ncbi:MAG: hypothetical protein HY574_14420 [candidate division NC10 bacterium]|nr:hypothetical protein [candidate division NC10 bacterium]